MYLPQKHSTPVFACVQFSLRAVLLWLMTERYSAPSVCRRGTHKAPVSGDVFRDGAASVPGRPPTGGRAQPVGPPVLDGAVDLDVGFQTEGLRILLA
jgi:hypothetical protein